LILQVATASTQASTSFTVRCLATFLQLLLAPYTPATAPNMSQPFILLQEWMQS